MSKNCLPNCPCESTPLTEFTQVFSVSPCVANIDNPMLFSSCPLLDKDVDRCRISVEVDVCDDVTVPCEVHIYSVAYTGSATFTVTVSASNGESCPVPEMLTFTLEPYDIGTQHCYYCEKPCGEEDICSLIDIPDLRVDLDRDANTVTITGTPVFNCPGA